MKLTKLPQEFEQASLYCKESKQPGLKAYFVGGSVRDTILGQPIHDVDIATKCLSS